MDEDQKLIDNLGKAVPAVSPDPNFKTRLRSELIERARSKAGVSGAEKVRSAFMSWTFSLQFLLVAVVVVVAVGISSDYLMPMGTKTDSITNESAVSTRMMQTKSAPSVPQSIDMPAPSPAITDGIGGGGPDVDNSNIGSIKLMNTSGSEVLEYMGMIRVYNFRSGALLENGAVIKGAMTSDWFWEGTSLARVEDEQGTQLGLYYVLTNGPADGDGYYPFELYIDRQDAVTATGWLIFEQSNGSGLPENQNQFRIPVRFE